MSSRTRKTVVVGETRYGLIKWFIGVVCSVIMTAIFYFYVFEPMFGEGILTFIASGLIGSVLGMIITMILLLIFIGRLGTE